MIPIFKPYMPEGINEGVQEILYSGNLAYGKWGHVFEEDIRNYLGTPNVLTVNSHSSAMAVVLSLLDIQPDDEIITSPISCLRSTQPFVMRKAKVIWADIDPKTGTLDPDSVKSKITSKTKAIFHNQHLGYCGYIDEINEIGREKGIPIIDDCIDGIGGVYKNKKVGNCGTDITITSFDAVRLPNTIDGGAIILKDADLFSKAKQIRDLGIQRDIFRDELGEISLRCDISIEGIAALIGEINSFIGHKQMKCFQELIEKRKSVATNWTESINRLQGCESLGIISETIPNYWVYGVLAKNQEETIRKFRQDGFYASKVHFDNSNYSLFGKKNEKLIGVKEFYKTFIALPCGWWF